MSAPLQAPFPYFGGKSHIAAEVWRRLGRVDHYVEPFLGSAAVLLARPGPWRGLETVNDLDGMVANWWRAVRAAPDEVAAHADWPVNENDLHARHAWLVGQKEGLRAQLEGDPEWYDARIAGWWAWGMSCWLGSAFCSGKGPWHVVDGQLVRDEAAGEGTSRRRVHLGNSGQGVHRKRAHLGNSGQGVHRKLVAAGADAEPGSGARLRPWFRALAARLARVRVCSGDWSRVVTPCVLDAGAGVTGIFFDPPYSADRFDGCYAEDSFDVAKDVATWAFAHGGDPRLRCVLAGYEGEHAPPAGWTTHAWKGPAGFSGAAGTDSVSSANSRLERLWCSPHCNRPEQGELFT